MSRSRIRYFIPHVTRGKVVECGEHLAHKLAKAPREEWKPFAIATGTVDSCTLVYVRTASGEVRCEVQTTQARRVSEAAIWVAAIHAWVALGNAAMTEAKATA